MSDFDFDPSDRTPVREGKLWKAGYEAGRDEGFKAGWLQSLRAAADVIGKAKRHWYGGEVAKWLRTFASECEKPRGARDPGGEGT